MFGQKPDIVGMMPTPDASTSREIVLERPPEAGATHREDRFDACFREHYARVLAYGMRRLSDRSAAEDVAAQAFLVAWRRLDDAPDDPLPWLLGIARHLIHNELRSSRRRERLAARIVAEGPRVESAPGDRSPVPIHIMDALRRLSERDREVLLLATWDGLDHRRAAAVLGCSRGTFTVRLHRARKRLEQELKDAQPAHAAVPTSDTGGCHEESPSCQTGRDRVARRGQSGSTSCRSPATPRLPPPVSGCAG